MNYYSKVSSRFWTGETGRAIRGDLEAQVVAAYLITSPHSNMLGLYYLPIAYIAQDTGMATEGASKGLRRVSERGFCRYDEHAEVVWVTEMARIQVGEKLEPKDNRVISIGREFESLPNNMFMQEFFDKYGAAYHLPKPSPYVSPLASPLATPSEAKAVAVAVAVALSELTPLAQSDSAKAKKKGNGAEKPEPGGTGAVVERIPLIGAAEFEVRESLVAEFDRLYPAVDIPLTLKQMRGWCMANPTKRKTASGALRFINAWLTREQNA